MLQNGRESSFSDSACVIPPHAKPRPAEKCTAPCKKSKILKILKILKIFKILVVKVKVKVKVKVNVNVKVLLWRAALGGAAAEPRKRENLTNL